MKTNNLILISIIAVLVAAGAYFFSTGGLLGLVYFPSESADCSIIDNGNTLFCNIGSGTRSCIEPQYDVRGQFCRNFYNTSAPYGAAFSVTTSDWTFVSADENGHSVNAYITPDGSAVCIENLDCKDVWGENARQSCPASIPTTTCSGTATFSRVQSPPNCVPDWQCSGWTACNNGNQIRTCSDQNNCADQSTKPVTSQSCTGTCAPDIECSEWTSCLSGFKSRTCGDLNYCNGATPTTETQTCFDFCTPGTANMLCPDDGDDTTVFNTQTLIILAGALLIIVVGIIVWRRK